MREEELIIEAKRRYPIGTVVKCASNFNKECISTHDFYLDIREHDDQGLLNLNECIVVCENTDSTRVFRYGDWAEIVSLPTPKITQKQKQTILNLIKEI